jgi:3-oxoacyl-[acyl-carrier protein] reductase
MELKDKVVIVTGAAQGLGRQFTLDCAANGMKVALADIDPDALEKTRTECEDKGVEARGYELTVTEESAVEDVYSQVVSDFGTLDASINNAGILRDSLLIKVKDGEIRKFPLSKWQAVIDTNLTGVFLCGREAAAQFVELKKPGVIINCQRCSLRKFWAKQLFCSKSGGFCNDRSLGAGTGAVRNQGCRHCSRVHCY